MSHNLKTDGKKTKVIPVNHFGDEYNLGISIEKISIKDSNAFDEIEQSQRNNWHSFHLIEKGIISIEIDFQKYEIISPALS